MFEEQDFKVKVTRAELEELAKDLIPRVTLPLQKVLDDSGMQLVF